MHNPVLNDPGGDPGGVRIGARRLAGAAESLTVVSRHLTDSSQQTIQAWEGQAQRMFSMLADLSGQVISGSSKVTSDIAGALDRYAGVLESCQNEVRLCRQRLQALVTGTSVGVAPDPVAVNTIISQANGAYAWAAQAAKELSANVLDLLGTPSANGIFPAPCDANVTFISQAHTGGLASTDPSAAASHVQAAQIQSQLNGVLNSLTGLVASRPMVNSALYPSSTIAGGGDFFVTDFGSAAVALGTTTLGGFVTGPATIGGYPLYGPGSLTFSPPAFTSHPRTGLGISTSYDQSLDIVMQQKVREFRNLEAKKTRADNNFYFNSPYDYDSIDGP